MTEGARCIAVFGASGRTGRELVEAALERRLAVRTLYRPGTEPRDAFAGLEVVTGQLSDADDVRRTLAGAQAACCAFGTRPPYTDVFCTTATANVIAQMRGLELRRLVCLTGAMIGPDTGGWTAPMRFMAALFRARFPVVAEDRARQERLVKESGLDWTLVKPPRLTDGPAGGRIHAATAGRIGLLSSIRRADLAAFLLDELTQGRFHGQAVYVAARGRAEAPG